MKQVEFINRLLSVTAFHNCEDIWWRFRDGGSAAAGPNDALQFFVNVNDIFWWGCSDVEEITPENIAVLEQAYKDIDDHAAILFACRVRNERPQGAWFAKGHFDAKYMPLFAACGPEREVGLGNPYPFMAKADYDASREPTPTP